MSISDDLRSRIERSRIATRVQTILGQGPRTDDDIRTACELACDGIKDATEIATGIADEMIANRDAARRAAAVQLVPQSARIAARIAQCEAELDVAA